MPNKFWELLKENPRVAARHVNVRSLHLPNAEDSPNADAPPSELMQPKQKNLNAGDPPSPDDLPSELMQPEQKKLGNQNHGSSR